MATIDFKPLINACAAAGTASAKVATEIGKLLKSKRRSQADTIKQQAYAALLGDRKAKDLSVTDKRTYDSMRTGFSRFYKSKNWSSGKTSSKTNSTSKANTDGFEFTVAKSAKPESVIKTIRTLAEWMKVECAKDEGMLKIAAYLVDVAAE